MKTQLFDFKQLSGVQVSEYEKVQWVDEALRMQAKVQLPAKISLKPQPEVFYNFMPVIIPALQIAGVKVVNRIPGDTPALTSQIMLYDLPTGALKAVMDGDYITTARTGAVAAHSIQLLAKHHFQSLGFIGLGNQARATAKAILTISQTRPMQVVLLKYKDQAQEFMAYLRSLKLANPLAIQIVNSPEAVFAASEVIISSVTYAKNDLLTDPSVMRAGSLLVPIHTRGFMNLDRVVDRIYCDSVDQIRNFKYFTQFRDLAQMSDVLLGQAPGRKNDTERLTVYNIGTALHDLFFAEQLYERLNGLGRSAFDWRAPTKKVWYDEW